MQSAHMEIAQQRIDTAKLDFDMAQSQLLVESNIAYSLDDAFVRIGYFNAFFDFYSISIIA